MGELLLELLSEEIPARMQRRAIDDLTGLIRDKLAEADIPTTSLAGYVTPRRLVVVAEGIPGRQPDREEERRGPRVGAPQQALDGFLRSAGLNSIAQCEVRGDFHFAVIKRPGRATAEVLPELIHAAMAALPWPKSMRYPASALRWVRPLNSVICLFDGEVLSLPLGEVPVGRATRGHRFLSNGEISVANAKDYLAKVAKAHVVLDWNERRQRIETQLNEKATGEGLTLKNDPGLLDEVAGLVEYPVVLMGTIDADFVRPLPDGLPPEVLATAMRMHQKYFSCLKPDGTPAPRFLFVANNVTPDKGAAIVAGNERVLRARLSDAKFFWDQDRKVRLEDRVEALKQRVYHEKLGSVYDKVERMEKLAEYLAGFVAGADPALCRRAARLAKADLSTGMVGEFPELQGVMGSYYAYFSPPLVPGEEQQEEEGEEPAVASAIAEHYKPLGPNDSSPTEPESIIVALADKVDALVGFFWAGERPTGSGDPFALRRAAQGVIRIVLENGLRVPLTNAFSTAGEALRLPLDHRIAVAQELLAFVADRLKVHLRERGVRHDLIAAAFEQVGVMGIARHGSLEDDLVRLLAKVDALKGFLGTEDGSNLLVAYRRASNLVAIEERKDNFQYGQEFDTERLVQDAERFLGQSLPEIGQRTKELFDQEKFEDAMVELAKLRGPVDEFFEKVTVNTADSELRANRLRLLARIRSTMNQIADFSQIEG
jgi:glycyl-tRNA synthetase beta chain